jgi:hypothetical protein
VSHVFPPKLERAYTVVDGRIQTRSLEAHIVDHCNLTCADCCSLSPLLPKWLAEPEQLARDLVAAARVLAPRVFKLVGGEPLLHPDIVEMVRRVKAANIAPRVSVTTNGLLLMRMPDAFFEAVDALTISLYPLPQLTARPEIEERAARFGVALNWKEQNSFVRMDRSTPASSDEIATVYRDCWLRERCHLIRDGVFFTFTCTRPPHFGTLRGRDFSRDGVRLDERAGLADELLAYLSREEPLEACALCFGGAAEMAPHRLMSRAEIVRLRGA